MKYPVLIIALLALGTLAHAESTLVTKLEVAGSGAFVCKAEAQWDHIQVVARAETRKGAEKLARKTCLKRLKELEIKKSESDECTAVACERDVTPAANAKTVFTIKDDGTNVVADSSPRGHYVCKMKSWGEESLYVARATTRLEAMTMTQNLCFEAIPDGGRFRIFCSPKWTDNCHDDRIAKNSEEKEFLMRAEKLARKYGAKALEKVVSVTSRIANGSKD